MSDLRQRVDAWLDIDLGRLDPADDAAPVRSRDAVASAVARGRRSRTRRRAVAVGSATAGLVAAATVGVIVVGGGSVTTAPRPPASRTPDGTASAPLPAPSRPAPSPSGTGAAAVGPIEVRYPYASGTLTVTWPAPASGRPWRVTNAETLESDDAATGFWRAVAPAVGADPAAPAPDPRVTVWGVAGIPTTYSLLYDVPVDNGAGAGVATASVLVSRGAIPDDGATFHPCGAWPDGVPGLGAARPDHLERCSLLSDVDARGRDLHVVRVETPGTSTDGPRQSVFTVRPDGLMVRVSFSAPVATTRLPGLDALDRLAREVGWPIPGGTPPGVTEVVYRVDGQDRTVQWPAPASGGPWLVEDPALPPGETAGPATAGARDLAAALALALPGAAVGAADGAAPSAALVGRVDGRPTAYLATVQVPGGGPTEWTVRATRGGVTTRPAAFDLCGTWPAGWTALGGPHLGSLDLGMSAGERSVWFEASGWPRRCTLVERDGTTVVHLAVPSTRPDTKDRSPAQAYAFTVRPDGTAVAAQVVGPVGAEPSDWFDRLDRLVLDLPYPSRP
ncbi:hypothetical protein [Kineosporia sp. A_224]|uniref:hypothetical protein n=1 Tax=Kineosporia sp. A_224 TaxID=1962180 RepID=UPI000B4BA93A|nr:hypothetical protein [Kineosporia sp. A_224]